MTVQSTKDFNAGTGLSATNKDAVAKLIKVWEKKNAERAVRGAGLGLVAVSLAACGGSGSDNEQPVDDGITRLKLVTTDVGKSFTLGEGPNVVTAEIGALAPFRDVALTQIIASAGDDDTLIVNIEFATDFSPLQLRDVEQIIVRAHTGSITGDIDLAPITGLTTLTLESLLANQTLTVVNVKGTNIVAGDNVLNLTVEDIGTGQIDAGALQRLAVIASDADVEIYVDGSRVEKGILELTVDLDSYGTLSLTTKNAPSVQLDATEVEELVVSALDRGVTEIDLQAGVGMLDGGTIIRLNDAIIDVTGIDAGLPEGSGNDTLGNGSASYESELNGGYSYDSPELDGIDVGGWQVRNIEVVNGVLTDVTSAQNIIIKGLGTFVELQGQSPNTTHMKVELEGDRGSLEFYNAAQTTLTVKGDANLEYFNVSNVITNLIVSGDVTVNHFIADLTALNLPSYASAQVMISGAGNVTLGYGSCSGTLDDAGTNGAKTINSLALDGTLTLLDVDFSGIGSADDVRSFITNVVKFNTGELVLHFAGDTNIYASDLAKLKSIDVADDHDLTVFDVPAADFTSVSGTSAFNAIVNKFVNIDDPADDVIVPAPQGELTLIGATDANLTVSYRQLVGRDFDIRIGTEGDGKATITNIGEGSSETTIAVGDLFVWNDTGRPGTGPVFLSGASNISMTLTSEQLAVVSKITAAGTGSISVTLTADDLNVDGTIKGFADIISKLTVADGQITLDFGSLDVSLSAAQLAMIDTIAAGTINVTDIPTSSVAQMGAIIAKLDAGTAIALEGALGADLSLTEAQVLDQDVTVSVNALGAGSVTISEIGFGDADKSVNLSPIGNSVLNDVSVDPVRGELILVAAKDVSLSITQADFNAESVAGIRTSGEGSITVSVVPNGGVIEGFSALVAKLQVENGDITIDAGAEDVSLTAGQLSTIDNLVGDDLSVTGIPTSSVAQMGTILAKLDAGTSINLKGAEGADLSLTEAQVLDQSVPVNVEATGTGSVTISEIGFGDADKLVDLSNAPNVPADAPNVSTILDFVTVDSERGEVFLQAAKDISLLITQQTFIDEMIAGIRTSGEGSITLVVVSDPATSAIANLSAMVAKLVVENGDITIDASGSNVSLTAGQLSTIDNLVGDELTVTGIPTSSVAQMGTILAKLDAGTSISLKGAEGADLSLTEAQVLDPSVPVNVEATGTGSVTISEIGFGDADKFVNLSPAALNVGNAPNEFTILDFVAVDSERGELFLQAAKDISLSITQDAFNSEMVAEIRTSGEGSITLVVDSDPVTGVISNLSGMVAKLVVENGGITIDAGSQLVSMTAAQLASIDNLIGGNVTITDTGSLTSAQIDALMAKISATSLTLVGADGADFQVTQSQLTELVGNGPEKYLSIEAKGDGVVTVNEVGNPVQPVDIDDLLGQVTVTEFGGVVINARDGVALTITETDRLGDINAINGVGGSLVVDNSQPGDSTTEQGQAEFAAFAQIFAGYSGTISVEAGTSGVYTLTEAQLLFLDSISGDVGNNVFIEMAIKQIGEASTADIDAILSRLGDAIGRIDLTAATGADITLTAAQFDAIVRNPGQAVSGTITTSGDGVVNVTEVSGAGSSWVRFSEQAPVQIPVNGGVADVFNGIYVDEVNGGKINLFGQNGYDFTGTFADFALFGTINAKSGGDITVTAITNTDIDSAAEYAGLVDRLLVDTGAIHLQVNGSISLTKAQLDRIDSIEGTVNVTITEIPTSAASDITAILGKVTADTDKTDTDGGNPIVGEVYLSAANDADVEIRHVDLQRLGDITGLTVSGDGSVVVTGVSFAPGVATAINQAISKQNGTISLESAFGADLSFTETEASYFASVTMLGADLTTPGGDTGEVTITDVVGGDGLVTSEELAAITDKFFGDLTGLTVDGGMYLVNLVQGQPQIAGANFSITADQLSSLQALNLVGAASESTDVADLTINDLGTVSAAEFDALLGKVSKVENQGGIATQVGAIIDVNVATGETVTLTEEALRTLRSLDATADEEFTANIVEISMGVDNEGWVNYTDTIQNQAAQEHYTAMLGIVDEEHGIINFVGARDISFRMTADQILAIDSVEVTGDLGEVHVVNVGGDNATSVSSASVQAIIDRVIGDDDGVYFGLAETVTSIVMTKAQLAAIEGSDKVANPPMTSVAITGLNALTAEGVEALLSEVDAKLAYAEFSDRSQQPPTPGNVVLEIVKDGTMTISQNDLLGLKEVTAVSGKATLTVTDYGTGASPTLFADVTAVADIETVNDVPSLDLHLIGALGIDLTFTSDELASIASVTTGETVTVTFAAAPYETDVDLSVVNADAVVDLGDLGATPLSTVGVSVTSFDVGGDNDVIDVNATSVTTVAAPGTAPVVALDSTATKVYVLSGDAGSFGDGSFLNWINAALDVDAGDKGTIVVNDGVETRIFSYAEGANAPTEIGADELTLVATIDSVLAADDILVTPVV